MRYVRPSETFIEDAYRRAVSDTLAGLEEETAVRIRWRLRMAAAQREVWTGAQLRRLLAERAGLEMSSASVSALFAGEPAQVKLATLAALCTALQCTPDDLFEVDTTPVERPRRAACAARAEGRPAAVRCRRCEPATRTAPGAAHRSSSGAGPVPCLLPAGGP